MSEKASFFHDRVRGLERDIELLQKKYNDFSIYRIALFIGFVVCTILCLQLGILSLLLVEISAFIIGFSLLVNKHNQIKSNKELCSKLLEINKEEIQRLTYGFEGIYSGEEFVDEKHAYSHDLDVYGKNSLFQLLNRAGTARGIKLLASWLGKPSSKDAIVRRQQAAMELAPKLDWRQNIQAYARTKANTSENDAAFFSWLKGKDLIRINAFYRILPYVLIIVSSTMIIGYLMEILSFYVFLFPIVISGYFLYKIVDYSKATYEMTQSGVRILGSFENIILQIEKEKFENEDLLRLQSSLMPQDIVASQKIKELRKIFDWLSQRGNQIYHIFNFIFLLDFILLARAEKWRASFKDEIPIWFEAIAEIEALNSIAAFTYAQESYAFPQIAAKPFLFQGVNIGHPLIPTEQRVSSDFSMEGKGSTCIITGSNMAGKSTFLRTIGVNAVLAFTGAPVCADNFSLSSFQVFTSMRTKDNLEENISSFYAELLRLKMLLEMISEEKPIMYLLDEILKGTNSIDRHLGAESLILQLNEMNTFGLVSTHDLELGNLDKSNEKIRNYNFSSSIIGEEIVFDYKLQEGICKSTNASQLMAKIGIQIKSKS